MRKYSLLFVLLLTTYFGFSQSTKNIDTTAIFILDKMNDVIGDLSSVSFELNNSIDKYDDNKNIQKYYSISKVAYSGPDKFVGKIEGSDGKKGFWYDGTYMSFYNYDENNYVTLEAPTTTLEMIDQMHLNFDFKFPAADFFYPSFTDDLIEAFDSIEFVGQETIDGETCYKIMMNNSEKNVQLWVSNKNYLLPKHFVIIYKNRDNMQYESSFSNWDLNPDIPNAVFEFLPPPNANLISILLKS